MKFIDYLRLRHVIRPGSKQLSEVSVEQYENRFHNLKCRGIYTTQREVTDGILQEIDQQYKNGRQHYLIPLRYYIEYLDYLEQNDSKKDMKAVN